MTFIYAKPVSRLDFTTIKTIINQSGLVKFSNRTPFEPVQRLGGYSQRARAAGFLPPVGCHIWRATGITIYLENDGRLEHAQQMAGHEYPRTTKLYDRTKDEITLPNHVYR